jgi:serine/threonine-protein kinase RsbW
MTSTEVIRLDLPATMKYLNVVGACIAEVLSRESDVKDLDTLIYNVQLATHEACTNIVDHAYAEAGGRIIILLAVQHNPRRLIVELHDTGQSFDLSTVKEPVLGEPQVRGYGLFLMRQIMDEVTYDAQAGHNRWRMVKRFGADYEGTM